MKVEGKMEKGGDLPGAYTFFRVDVYWALRLNIQTVCIGFYNFKALFLPFECN